MKNTRSNGHTYPAIHYHITGLPHRPTILFLHGFMGRGEDWKPIITQLSSQFRCLTVDLPGHGQSASIASSVSWRMENTSRALIALLEELTIHQCFLVGYSMGGRLALYLTLHFPQFFEKVILESVSPGLKTGSERVARMKIDKQRAQKLENHDFQSFLTRWYQQPLFRSLSKHPQFNNLLERRLQNNPTALAKSLREMGTGIQPSLWEQLRYNKIPLLLVVGEKDAKFKAIAEEMTVRCQSASIELAPCSGHNIHFERPDVFVKIIWRFFKNDLTDVNRNL